MKAYFAEHGRFAQRDVAEPVTSAGELLVSVAAAGLTAADTAAVRATYLPGLSNRAGIEETPMASLALGFEIAGEVLAVGSRTTGFEVGDRVMAPCSGGLATRVTVRADVATRVPARLSWVEAAGIPVAFATAHDALLDAGRLQPHDQVLVIAASSAVGIATLQLADLVGAGRLIAAVESPHTLEWLQAQGVPFDLGLVTTDPEFVHQAMAATSWQGFDVIVDTLGTNTLSESLALCAVLGRVVCVEPLAAGGDRLDIDELARKRASIVGSSLRLQPSSRSASVYRRAAAEVVPAIEDGRLKVTVDRAFPFEDACAAYEWHAHGRAVGTVVVQVS